MCTQTLANLLPPELFIICSIDEDVEVFFNSKYRHLSPFKPKCYLVGKHQPLIAITTFLDAAYRTELMVH